jgi:hypothetical protein
MGRFGTYLPEDKLALTGVHCRGIEPANQFLLWVSRTVIPDNTLHMRILQSPGRRQLNMVGSQLSRSTELLKSVCACRRDGAAHRNHCWKETDPAVTSDIAHAETISLADLLEGLSEWDGGQPKLNFLSRACNQASLRLIAYSSASSSPGHMPAFVWSPGGSEWTPLPAFEWTVYTARERFRWPAKRYSTSPGWLAQQTSQTRDGLQDHFESNVPGNLHDHTEWD